MSQGIYGSDIRRDTPRHYQHSCPPETLGLIGRAARVAGKTRMDFILDIVKQAAEDAILDQRLFLLDPAQWDAFVAMLDAPARPNKRLEAFLARSAPWENDCDSRSSDGRL